MAGGRPRKRLLKVEELCEYLAISRGTAYSMMAEGCPYVQVSSYRRFDLGKVMKWLDGRTLRQRRNGHGARSSTEDTCRPATRVW